MCHNLSFVFILILLKTIETKIIDGSFLCVSDAGVVLFVSIMSMFCTAHSMMPVGTGSIRYRGCKSCTVSDSDCSTIASHDHVNWNTVDESAFID